MFTTYDIFNELLGLRNTVDSFFNELPIRSGSYSEFPYINIYNKNDSIIIKAIMPGVAQEEISIDLVGNGLIISGERKSDLKDNPYIRKEREFGKFKKSIKLPYSVDRDNIDAGLKDGILTIKLVKSEDAKPKRIEIR